MIDPRTAAAFFLVSMAVGASGCKKSEAAVGDGAGAAKADIAAPVKVQTAVSVAQQVPEYLTLTGDLSANEQSELAADATGKVIATNVERGQTVKKGDVIATLDTRSASLQQQAMLAQANFSKSQVDLAQVECQRGQRLYDSGAISKADYDRTMSTCSTTRYSLEAAEANRNLAQKTLGDANIRAPFAGTIGERYVNVGQYVQPQTRIASVYQVDPLRLSLTVPEADVALIQPAMSVAFQVNTFPDQTFTGTVKYISPNVRVSSRDLVVEAIVPNADGKLRPGMFATVRLVLRQRTLPAVPQAALKRDDVTQRVFVVGKDGKADERIVQIADGSESAALVGIVSGLKAGESVVVSPPDDLKDGSSLETSGPH
jgi:membrane fusion protein (multidrug efflux system)